MIKFYALILATCFAGAVTAQNKTAAVYHEKYRPQFHFSPKAHWMNDPNGMVYSKGVYHLFFQYNPTANVPGNIHWGHATSTDLFHWKEKPIALYPDSLGLVFSGSTVIDKNNTSRLGTGAQPPMVALYASHSVTNEKMGRLDVETQSLAYSNDDGLTWKKYKGNPVIKNTTDRDFRDPKVMWYEPQKKWVMVLAAHDHIDIFSSKNLIDWAKESDFGREAGDHGGVWECPDLFELQNGAKKQWALIVNINPGGPNGGSATQYFMGDFNGKNFTPADKETKWLNYGPDNYAGVTWSNTGARKIFLGWMSNWLYGDKVPTGPWRGAMTTPVELNLKTVNDKAYLTSTPVKELYGIIQKTTILKNITVKDSLNIKAKLPSFGNKFIMKLAGIPAADFSIVLYNKNSEQVRIGYDKKLNKYYINRSSAGITAFQKDFVRSGEAPRVSNSKSINLTLIIDEASAELFADDGLSNLTGIFFGTLPMSGLKLYSPKKLIIGSLSYSKIGQAWSK